MARPSALARRARLALATLTVTAAVAAAPACSRNPATGRVQLLLIDESQEIEIGKKGDAEILATLGAYDESPAASALVEEVGRKLAAESERPGLPWTFRVLDDPGVNAFALPGGPVYVTRGLLAHLNSEDELAAVLGHEIGHVAARHGAVQLRKTRVAQSTVGLFRVVDPSLQHIGGIAARTANLALLKYSRNDENQADDLSVRYVRRGGYDPNAVTDVFEILAAVTKASGQRIPTWQSSHPEPEARAQRIAANLRASGVADTAPAPQPEFLAKLQGIVVGEDPRQGFFIGRTFVHPNAQLQIDLPPDWEAAHDDDNVLALHPDKNALFLLAPSVEESAKAAIDKFFTDASVQRGEAWTGRVGGFPVESSAFAIDAGSGRLPGLVAFVEFRGRVLAMVAIGPADQWEKLSGVLAETFGSLRQLQDARLRDVPPMRLQLLTLPEASTIAALEAAQPSALPVAAIARLNQVAEDETLEAGRVVKRVAGFNAAALTQ
jgi:predicted Zn-dependent protease